MSNEIGIFLSWNIYLSLGSFFFFKNESRVNGFLIKPIIFFIKYRKESLTDYLLPIFITSRVYFFFLEETLSRKKNFFLSEPNKIAHDQTELSQVK